MEPDQRLLRRGRRNEVRGWLKAVVMARFSLLSVGILFAVVTCRAAPTGVSSQPTSSSPPPTTAEEPAVTESPVVTEQDLAADTEEAVAPWCDRGVVVFPGSIDGGQRPLREVIAETELVTIAVPILRRTDCTSVGHLHLVFGRLDGEPPTQDGAAQVTAYRSVRLHVPSLERANYYLMGATPTDSRQVNLRASCVAYEGRVNARIEWLLPLADLDEVREWSERLRSGSCGRPPLHCSAGCSSECPGTEYSCCTYWEDSCGENGEATCGGYRACEQGCCE